MGCRCCKMIQSYLFEPVQVPSPGYVNEVSGCKLDEEDPVKLKGRPSAEGPAHRSDLQREGVRRTGSRGRRAGPQEPGGPCAEKPGGAANGIGPAGDPGPGRPQDGTGSWAGTAADSGPPARPFLEGAGAGETDSAETRVVGDGDSRVSSEAECPPIGDVPGPVPQIPAPDYPPYRGSAGDRVDRREKEGVLQGHPEEEEEQQRPEDARPGAGEPGLDLPSFPGERSWGSGERSWGSGKRSWGSVNGAVAAEALSVRLEEEADAGSGWGDARRAPGGDGEAEEEDAEVAEALAALAAATAGEDGDNAD